MSSVEDGYGRRLWARSRVEPHICPRCQSAATQRSRRRGTLELALLDLLPVRPFRCRDCDRRFYGFLFNLYSLRSKTPIARGPRVGTRLTP